MSEEERDEAAELAARARVLHERRDYQGAQACYERSLELRQDERVLAEYLRLLAAIGPK